MSHSIEDAIIAKAHEVGFDQVGFSDLKDFEQHSERLKQFIELGRHGDMTWMEEKYERRKSPHALWPEVQSVIMLGMNYGPKTDPLSYLEHQDRGVISVYAKNKDYHDIVKKKLKQIARWIAQTYEHEVKVFVDTAPVMEKPLAQRAGLGWQGKHSNLVSREYGSWLFLGSIYTTLELTENKAEEDHCGSCRKCLDICPTKAFPAPYQIDANRCISYLTIEYKGHIDRELRPLMGNHIYGCDDCLSVCPWNKYAQDLSDPAYLPRVELDYPELRDLVGLDDASFREVFTASPIKRIGRDYFIRNVLIAMGNSNNKSYIEQIVMGLEDEAAVVRAMAIWALSQLCDDPHWQGLKAFYRPNERDEVVRQEWDYR